MRHSEPTRALYLIKIIAVADLEDESLDKKRDTAISSKQNQRSDQQRQVITITRTQYCEWYNNETTRPG